VQLQDKSGISCDKCGIACKLDFIYYNLDVRKIDVHRVRPDTRTALRLPVVKSFDLCSNCFDVLSTTIINNFKEYQITKRFMCEISKADMTTLSVYYFVDAQKIEVNTSRQPYVCVTCKTKCAETKCKCGSTKFIRPAKLQVTKDIVQFNIHPCVYDTWAVHKPTSTEWDTKS